MKNLACDLSKTVPDGEIITNLLRPMKRDKYLINHYILCLYSLMAILMNRPTKNILLNNDQKMDCEKNGTTLTTIKPTPKH